MQLFPLMSGTMWEVGIRMHAGLWQCARVLWISLVYHNILLHPGRIARSGPWQYQQNEAALLAAKRRLCFGAH